MPTLPRNTILIGDARQRLSLLPSASVDCAITSPPYFQLRDYGMSGQLGLEPTVEGWVRELRTVFRGLARVLKPTGSVWLDLGDSYSKHRHYGTPHKGLLLAPERLVLALSRDGWLVRNKVIWAKTNPMPTSVSDRLNTTYDVVYFLTRSSRYFFDLDAIREPHKTAWRPWKGRRTAAPPSVMGPLANDRSGFGKDRPGPGHPLGKNPGDVWSLSTVGYRGPHFGTFPPSLVRRPLIATCPARICTSCGEPWRTRSRARLLGQRVKFDRAGFGRQYLVRYEVVREAPRLEAACSCQASTRPGVVLDPFFGTGTVGVVASSTAGTGWESSSTRPTPSWPAADWPRADRLSVRQYPIQ